MSTEDAKYYLEVTTRCSQKMLDIYSNWRKGLVENLREWYSLPLF
jgi:hypothetical protein